MPDIFEYINFRNYLADYYRFRKEKEPGFTHSFVCFRLGQEKSKGYFNNVIKGRTNVTATFINRFIELLDLKGNQANYFRAMVNYNQTVIPAEKEFYFEQIVRLNNTPFRIVDKNTYQFYKEWYHGAIRALLDVIDFENDIQAVTSRLYPAITLKQARESIALLKQLGLIKKNGNGFWKPTDKVITTGEFIRDELIRQYQMKCCSLAQSVIADDTKQTHRNITMTISVSDTAYDRIIDRILGVKSEIRSIVHKDDQPATKVCHLNMNIFPMSK
ncbi:MAG: TIGR02147 family protein [Chitinispirillaceae bacterium]|nr:TIGR02147 family protein [Chitinispirillaceae bacterium]